MCRFLAYLGKPKLIEELLFKPDNSLIKQALQAKESEYVVNGDGFGLGWYLPDLSDTPGVFHSVRPAWNDSNLKSISASIKSPCFFAHVRAATAGIVSQTNCHPFASNHLMMMHNGHIGEFSKLKRALRHSLSDTQYSWISGQTDTEHFCALLLEHLPNNHDALTCQDMVDGLTKTVSDLKLLSKQAKIKEASHINFAVTNGNHMVAMRYTDQVKSPPPTLYYTHGEINVTDEGKYDIDHAKDPMNGVLIVSEKLDNKRAYWHEVPVNHFITINGNNEVHCTPVPKKSPKS